jgi:hypothetical protein
LGQNFFFYFIVLDMNAGNEVAGSQNFAYSQGRRSLDMNAGNEVAGSQNFDYSGDSDPLDRS